ncbi:hypothetical protein PI95_031100 [Hassallia byssoidea VB512170]|uniref:Uncharacterized protein n=1 Tax=Hassallia byssoidea VB512170 TaxID=1304833 RepID=A0A846HH51_9CYAN|nr:hypothetical protein [Hassalia byssoidea]NEU76837.1 hypothetical protein [Hassalia byssoidea VB512170]
MLLARQEISGQSTGNRIQRRIVNKVLSGAGGGTHEPLEVKTLYYKKSPIRVVIAPEGLEWVALDILRALFPSDEMCSNYWALQTLPIGFRPKRLIKSEDKDPKEKVFDSLLNVKQTLRFYEIPNSELQEGLSYRTVILHEVLFGWLSRYLSYEVIHDFFDWFSNHPRLVNIGCKRQYRVDVTSYFA